MPRPNLLFIFADQMRASTLGALHDEQVLTPNLDRLAEQGVLFTNAIANSPVCTPSRASMITGKHALSARCFINDIRLPVDERSIADELNRSGYVSAYIGKWHLDGISRHMFTAPERRHGFDDYWAAYNCNHDYFDPKFYINDDPTLVRFEGYGPEVETNLAIGYLQRQRQQPFNLWVSFGTPHDPYDKVPQRFKDLYPPEKIKLRPNMISPDHEAISGYYAHITALDEQVGRLLNTLDELNLTDNTLVVFSSDHGDMLWSHMMRNKQLPYEESIHIPLIMRLPGKLPEGLRTDLLCSVVDLAPTLLSLLGEQVPEQMQGSDLSTHLAGNTQEKEPTSVFINSHAAFDQARGMQPWRGVRTKKYTYARWLQGSCVLFDNENDPYQFHNLALQEKYAPIIAKLEAELSHWLRLTDDAFLPAETHITQAGQQEEWFLREEHFRGGYNY